MNPAAQSRSSILIVDDETALLEVSASLLTAEGYEVKTANSVREARKILDHLVPDIIVSDINMPGETGFDLYQYVRSAPRSQHVPFIFLTGHSDVESIKKGKEIGSDDYLTKPFDITMLLSVIKGKLTRRDQLKASQMSQIDEIKSHLFRIISHEIRTPLTSILGATEMLSDTSEPLSPGEWTAFLTMLQVNSRRLTGMVDDILLATKIESGQLAREIELVEVPINPHSLLERIAAGFERKDEEGRSAIRVNAPDEILTLAIYPPHLDDMLRRLTDNAIKFSPDGSPVDLSATVVGGIVRFSVKDRGKGIPREKHAHLFLKFQQVDRERFEQQGTGLGLFITDQIVRLNGGTLTLESEEGKGSVFSIDFPLVRD